MSRVLILIILRSRCFKQMEPDADELLHYLNITKISTSHTLSVTKGHMGKEPFYSKPLKLVDHPSYG